MKEDVEWYAPLNIIDDIQQRVGKNGVMFGLFKFATMLKDSPNLGTGTVTVKNDPRVLPLGKFLRKTKINELTRIKW